MNLSRSATLVVGALTILPLGFFAYVLLSSPLRVLGSDAGLAFDLVSFHRFLMLTLVFDVWVLGLLGFYLTYLARSWQIPRGRRVGWAVALVLGSWFVMPAFWYLHLWRASKGFEKPSSVD